MKLLEKCEGGNADIISYVCSMAYVRMAVIAPPISDVWVQPITHSSPSAGHRVNSRGSVEGPGSTHSLPPFEGVENIWPPNLQDSHISA